MLYGVFLVLMVKYGRSQYDVVGGGFMKSNVDYIGVVSETRMKEDSFYMFLVTYNHR